MKKLRNEGFTLIELLAAISILAVIMLMAIPNVVGIVQRNKYKTYVEDSKKLITLAKYEIRKNASSRPSYNSTKELSLDYLDKSKEIDDAPNGNKYDRNISKVEVKNEGGTFIYTVTLVEKKLGKWLGVIGKLESKLYSSAISDLVGTAVELAAVGTDNPSQVIDTTPPTVLISSFYVNGVDKKNGYYNLKTMTPFSATFTIEVCDNESVPILNSTSDFLVGAFIEGSNEFLYSYKNWDQFAKGSNVSKKCLSYSTNDFSLGINNTGILYLKIKGLWRDSSGNKTSGTVIFGGETTTTKFYS